MYSKFSLTVLIQQRSHTLSFSKIQFQITKETAEIVVSQAIDLWQEYGGPTGLVISESIKK